MEVAGSIFDPRVVFKSFVEQLYRVANQLNELAALDYLTHYRNLELNWRVASIKLPHRDPEKKWIVYVNEEKMEAHLAKGTDPVIEKMIDPWSALRPARPLPSSSFGPSIGGPDFPDAYYYVESTNPAQPGSLREGPDGRLYRLHVIPGIFGVPVRFWKYEPQA